jgi:hypothetical protein
MILITNGACLPKLHEPSGVSNEKSGVDPVT